MKELISRLQAPRSVGAHLRRLLVVRIVGTTLLAAAVLYGQTLTLQSSGAELEAMPGLSPSWSSIDRAAYPGCVDADDWPPNTWGGSVVAYSSTEGTTSRIEFEQAWERTHNTSAHDDLTVLGICR